MRGGAGKAPNGEMPHSHQIAHPARSEGRRTSTDVGGSPRIWCWLKPSTIRGTGLFNSMDRTEAQAAIFDWRIQNRHYSGAGRSNARRYGFAIAHLAAVRAVLWAGHIHVRRHLHFGRHNHFGHVHRAGLNYWQAHPRRHEDSEQHNKNAFGQMVHHSFRI